MFLNFKRPTTHLFLMSLFVLAFSSCAAPNYLPGPIKTYPSIQNTLTFGVQNMDGSAKVEGQDLTCHYEGFDVTYKLSTNLLVSMVVINNSNKSLILDKSKCYVLYDGYSTPLFKDVRSTRSTTFNNVQDAISDVQTNEAGVSMTIPPYSKWEIPLPETNLHEIKKLPAFNKDFGVHALTPYDDQETVEFVIPYTFDYSLSKWNTSRNRIFVNSINVEKGPSARRWKKQEEELLSTNQYRITLFSSTPDYDIAEANRIDAINWKKYKKHKNAVTASHIVWGTILLPTIWGALIWFMKCGHKPHLYGNTNLYQ